jgi:hypothetical protein
MKEKIWIGRNEAAIMLGCTMQTISNYLKDGLIIAKTVNKKVMIDRRSLTMMAPDLTEIYNLGKKVEEAKQQLSKELKDLESKQAQLRKTAGLLDNSIIHRVNEKFILSMLGYNGLVQREQDVVQMLVEGLSLDYIADYYDITRERTRQIAEKACRKLFANITRFKNLSEQNNSLMELNAKLRDANKMLSESIKQNEADIEEKQVEINKEELALFATPLVDFDLSVRALNCLKSAEIETFGQLISMDKGELLRFRNFGKKSLAELNELVTSKGYYFGYKPTQKTHQSHE